MNRPLRPCNLLIDNAGTFGQRFPLLSFMHEPAQKSKRVVAAMALIALLGLGSVIAIGFLFVNQIREKRSAAHAAPHEAQQQR